MCMSIRRGALELRGPLFPVHRCWLEKPEQQLELMVIFAAFKRPNVFHSTMKLQIPSFIDRGGGRCRR